MKINPPENLIYNELNHTYIRKSDGKLLAGVSSVSDFASNSQKVNALMNWAVKESLSVMREGFDSVKTKEDLALLLEKARTAHSKKSTEAKETGTDVHALIEMIIKGKPLLEEEENLRAIKQFRAWEKLIKVSWEASELLVGDTEDLECAGRLDALATINGKLTLIDFKVANALYPSYYLQTAGYGLLLEKMGVQIVDRLILRLPKTEKRKVWIVDGYKMVDNNLEAVRVPTDYEFDKKTFRYARELSRWFNQQTLKEPY